jgi:uncharacterized protein YecT (DUF1311 family)
MHWNPARKKLIWKCKLGAPFLIAGCGVLLWLTPAQAIDCKKASGKIEFAICADEALGRKDAELAEKYFALARRISQESAGFERKVLLGDQRDWIRRRTRECDAAEPAPLRDCINSSIDRRREQLAYEWGEWPQDRDLPQNKFLLVGPERLLVGSSPTCGESALLHRNKVVACGFKSLYFDPPFAVRRRLKNGEDEAVLLEVHQGGQMNCSSYYVLTFEARSGLRTQSFGGNCGTALRSAQGFEWRREATSDELGERMEWNWRSGISKAQKFAYVPKGGTHMSDLVNAKEQQHAEPLNNAEFLRAVSAIPEADRGRFLTSLAGLYEGCDCAGSIDYKLYGLRNTNDAYAISTCGMQLEGYYVHCRGADALAIWDKKTQQFHFAIVTERANGKDARVRVRTYPKAEEWSEIARAQLEDWKSGKEWE